MLVVTARIWSNLEMFRYNLVPSDVSLRPSYTATYFQSVVGWRGGIIGCRGDGLLCLVHVTAPVMAQIGKQPLCDTHHTVWYYRCSY